MSHSTASSTAGRRRAGKRIGCVGIVCAAAVTLGLSVDHGLQATAAFLRPASVRQATAAYRQEECIYHAIRSELPEGAAVYVDSPDWPVQQRLAELSTLWAVPQASPTTARWTISLVPRSSPVPGSTVPRHCYGLVLEVRRR